MNINDMKYGEVLELKKQLSVGGVVESVESRHPYTVGENYFVRAVTHHFTGKLEGVYAQELVFSSCCWIPDDGRFADAMADFSELGEIEPFPKGSRVVVGRGALIDAHQTDQEIPSMQK